MQGLYAVVARRVQPGDAQRRRMARRFFEPSVQRDWRGAAVLGMGCSQARPW